MIRTAAWFCTEHHGLYAPLNKSWQQPSPSLSATAEIPALIGRPVKYYARMTAETRYCLCSASIALKSAGWDSKAIEIGLLSAGSDGCAHANEEYFRDYVANGRTLGRGNLFIYTLPTSALGEVAIALSLTGPSIFLHDPTQPLACLNRTAEQIISDGEATGMLALWSDASAAVCLAIDRGQSPDSIESLATNQSNPLQLCQKLQQLVRQA